MPARHRLVWVSNDFFYSRYSYSYCQAKHHLTFFSQSNHPPKKRPNMELAIICQKHKPFTNEGKIKNILLLDFEISCHYNENKTLHSKHYDSESQQQISESKTNFKQLKTTKFLVTLINNGF